MIILLLVLSILATVVGFAISIKSGFEPFGLGLLGCCAGIVGSCLCIVLIVMFLFCADDVISERTIGKKIVAYEEMNKEIETQIGNLVQNYMEYEKDTFESVKNEDYMSLVQLYPELKSNELVQSQMSVYVENNKKILELQEQKIDISKSKWWLYFGK